MTKTKWELFSSFVVLTTSCGILVGPSSVRANDIMSEGLWAGRVTAAFGSPSEDPCGDSRYSLYKQVPIQYDEWTRERAELRRICFEVWAPGVTDNDATSYWQKLDVKVRYSLNGVNQWKYIKSIGRRGKNRIYAWDLNETTDPFLANSGIGAIMMGLLPESRRVLIDDAFSALVVVPLEFSFSINDKRLSAESDSNFIINYSGWARKTRIVTREVGQLTDVQMVCGSGLRVGRLGAGFAIEISEPFAVSNILQRLSTSNRYEGLVTKSVQGFQTTVTLQFFVSLPSKENEIHFQVGPGTSVALLSQNQDQAILRIETGLLPNSQQGEWVGTFSDCQTRNSQ